MRRAGEARSQAARAIQEVIENGQPASPLLLARSAGLSPEDASLMREVVLGVLRHRAGLDAELAWACHAPLERLTPGLREILEVGLYQLRHLERVPAYAAVDEAVRDARGRVGEKAARLVNAVLRRLLRSSDHQSQITNHKSSRTAADLSIRYSHPEFLVSRWLSRFGPETTFRVLETDNAPSGLDLMANPRRTTRETLAGALAAEGIVTEASPFSPLALTVLSGNPLKSRLLENGHFSVQDVGSQALVLLFPPGEMLIDLAAAPGGKSFAAVALGRARRALAFDRTPARLLRVREAALRLGIPEVQPIGADVLAPPLPSGRFDRILFDAPCSGTGTLRKNPEIRYRVTPDAIERLAGAQKAGLAAAASLLSPGGLLLYSTCSLELEENEAVVKEVLADVPGLEPAPIEAPDALRPFVFGARFQLLPGPTNDGFTAHLLRRRPA